MPMLGRVPPLLPPPPPPIIGGVPGILVLLLLVRGCCCWIPPNLIGVLTRDAPPSAPSETWSNGLEAVDISGVEAADMSSEEALNCDCRLLGCLDEVRRLPLPTGLDFCLDAFLCSVVLKCLLRWPELVNHLSHASHW